MRLRYETASKYGLEKFSSQIKEKLRLICVKIVTVPLWGRLGILGTWKVMFCGTEGMKGNRYEGKKYSLSVNVHQFFGRVFIFIIFAAWPDMSKGY